MARFLAMIPPLVGSILGGGSANPSYPAIAMDAGTSEGARKAAQTRKAGGGHEDPGRKPAGRCSSIDSNQEAYAAGHSHGFAGQEANPPSHFHGNSSALNWYHQGHRNGTRAAAGEGPKHWD